MKPGLRQISTKMATGSKELRQISKKPGLRQIFAKMATGS
jgi:hypothetical protein